MKSDLKPSSQGVLADASSAPPHNEENGFCVLRTKARGHRDLVTVVTQAASISSGEWITASGGSTIERPNAAAQEASSLSQPLQSGVNQELGGRPLHPAARPDPSLGIGAL